MGRHFFTGGMMPSHDLLPRVCRPAHPRGGLGRARDALRAHLRGLAREPPRQLEAAVAALTGPLSPAEARVQVRRWQMFFLACAELFGFDGGREWQVSHYRLAKAGGTR